MILRIVTPTGERVTGSTQDPGVTHQTGINYIGEFIRLQRLEKLEKEVADDVLRT